jgi:hypothetical protein
MMTCEEKEALEWYLEINALMRAIEAGLEKRVVIIAQGDDE